MSSAPGQLRALASNAVSLTTVQVAIRGTNFVIYAFVGRHLGVVAVGQLALGLRLIQLFSMFTVVGQGTLTMREVARSRKADPAATSTSIAVTVFGTVLAAAPLALLLRFAGWSSDTEIVVLVVFIGLLPTTVSAVLEGVFQGQERMHMIAAVAIPVHLLKLAVAIWLITGGSGLLSIAFVIAAARWVVLVAEVFVFRLPAGIAAPAFGEVLERARRGAGFLGAGVFFAIASTSPFLVVSVLLDDRAVGVLAAAQQMIMPLAIIINAAVMAAFPRMSRAYKTTLDGAGEMVHLLMGPLFALVLPVVVLLVVFPQDALLFLYGKAEFADSAELLRIFALGALVNVVASVLGQLLWAADRERYAFRIAVIYAAANVAIQTVLVSIWGLSGIVYSVPIVGLLLIWLHQRGLDGVVRTSALLGTLSWPFIAAVMQAVAMSLLPDMHVVLRALAGGLVYAAVLAVGWILGWGVDPRTAGRAPT